MTKQRLLIIFILWLSLLSNRGFTQYHNAAETTAKFIQSLDAVQRSSAIYSFEDTLRKKWKRLPGQRNGLLVKDMGEAQKILFHQMLRHCLTEQGYLKATSIMFNEDIQARNEPNLGPNLYWVAIYGSPNDTGTWSWRVEGHHLSLHFTFREGRQISSSPCLMGSNPAVVIKDSIRAGLAILYYEENYAKELIRNFTSVQQKKSFLQDSVSENLIIAQKATVHFNHTNGINSNELNEGQKLLLQNLVHLYFSNFPAILTPKDQDGSLYFAWAGSLDPALPFYYRIQHQNYFIEFNNAINHIHMVLRTRHDFGNSISKK